MNFYKILFSIVASQDFQFNEAHTRNSFLVSFSLRLWKYGNCLLPSSWRKLALRRFRIEGILWVTSQ